MSTSAFIICVLVLLWVLRKYTQFRDRTLSRAPYPPGPVPKPLIGNALDFPISFPALKYAEWGNIYKSQILHIEAFGQHIVVLNNREDAEELLDRRAKLYSDRPEIPVMKLMGWSYNIAILRYGDEWRRCRKICQQNFNQKASQAYQPLQRKEVLRFLQALHSSPKEFDAHSKRLSISLTMLMMYGYEVQSISDPVVTVADEAIRLGGQLVIPGGTLINIFPMLQHIPAWFPGASSQKLAKIVRELSDEMMSIPTKFVKKSLEEGTAVPSFVTDFYVKKQTHGATLEEEEMVKNIAFSVYGGASDTTISATGTFLWAMAVNPNVMKKAQSEIDTVIGLNRLPTFEDRDSLPYIEAIYREVLRSLPPLPLGGPHTTIQDDHYKGYFIPKGGYQPVIELE
ncbi:Cytochrome P450 monooxygenase 208 [Psilocybe cubensis]|uniref:Cytochrome P450 monooxygenase 208 n=1 Tax=Psilocybe cubensis TaxID=181762 RepID=A0ACB8GTN5_PSICU|nr:Cytochrome P450 monooxygenase 208 [Psilocybe cubensis]KAH9478384.1 Cytochrome P450 monooxygenase 208 [Psilocybe cubensis]